MTPLDAYHKQVAKDMKESALQNHVIGLARTLGYRVAHFRSVQVMRGGRLVWMTPVQADGAGFPDLVLAGKGKVIFAELKRQSNKASLAQLLWLDALFQAGAKAYVWKPTDWLDGTIEQILRRE